MARPNKRKRPEPPKDLIGVTLRASQWRLFAREAVLHARKIEDHDSRKMLTGLSANAMKLCTEKPGEERVEIRGPRDHWKAVAGELVTSFITPTICREIHSQIIAQEPREAEG